MFLSEEIKKKFFISLQILLLLLLLFPEKSKHDRRLRGEVEKYQHMYDLYSEFHKREEEKKAKEEKTLQKKFVSSHYNIHHYCSS